MSKNNFFWPVILGLVVLLAFFFGFKLGFKWPVFLLGLFIIASLPIIFSSPKDPLDDIKIIVEKD